MQTDSCLSRRFNSKQSWKCIELPCVTSFIPKTRFSTGYCLLSFCKPKIVIYLLHVVEKRKTWHWLWLYRGAKPFMIAILEATYLYLSSQQYLQKASLSRRWRNHSLMSLNDSLNTFFRGSCKNKLYNENSATYSIMITFRSHYSLLRTLILIIKNVLSGGFHQKPHTTTKLDLMPSGPWW